jgi:hypothetical protein
MLSELKMVFGCELSEPDPITIIDDFRLLPLIDQAYRLLFFGWNSFLDYLSQQIKENKRSTI